MSAAGTRVWVAGGTGLVGRALLATLETHGDVARTISFERRASAAAGATPRLERRVVDFARLDAAGAAAPAAAFCALGTTIRAAGSRDAFRRVDHDAVLAFARQARAAGATRFGLVSALGADPAARVFYNRVKGETEAALGMLGFAVLVIARPSLLLGAREEFRLGERLATPFARLLPARWRGIEAAQVARALVTATLQRPAGTHVLENAELLAG